MFWMISTSPNNFKIDRDKLGFKLIGLPDAYREKVMSLRPGDRVVYYVSKEKKFGAITTVTGTYFQDSSKTWLKMGNGGLQDVPQNLIMCSQTLK